MGSLLGLPVRCGHEKRLDVLVTPSLHEEVVRFGKRVSHQTWIRRGIAIRRLAMDCQRGKKTAFVLPFESTGFNIR
ncbi:hypothetical protein RE6C_03195 [Rhodopirellula europaea 6C]|uniref:Uncharacterized protein n=1 Tax=Rhodopirellula europaea 6C TaxID=1263867 RepID=M2B1G8_9BACT|nr:hypothetical protein RE6C_03195 [Rhodopirellula europaea 6C]